MAIIFFLKKNLVDMYLNFKLKIEIN